MPYIKLERRTELENGDRPQNAGELNFAITKILLRHWKHSAQNYEAINSIVGAVECAKAEFTRRITEPYENKKCLENGDVY